MTAYHAGLIGSEPSEWLEYLAFLFAGDSTLHARFDSAARGGSLGGFPGIAAQIGVRSIQHLVKCSQNGSRIAQLYRMLPDWIRLTHTRHES